MKPAPFEYYAPTTRDEVLALLAEHGGEAKVLAGGQSLVPSMNFRLAQPAILVDLNRVSDLAGIQALDGGGLRIGAMTRQRSVERSGAVAEQAPLVAEAMPQIAHPQIRNRGTFGGSIAHNDPAAELPALMVALDAQMHVAGPGGERIVPARAFFQGIFTTALEPDEILVAVNLPASAPRTGSAFAEVARRHGDYAMAGAAAVLTLSADGTVAACRLVFFSIADGPLEVQSPGEALRGVLPAAGTVETALAGMDAEIDPPSDIHATAAYRRHLCRVLARRTLALAAERARPAAHRG